MGISSLAACHISSFLLYCWLFALWRIFFFLSLSLSMCVCVIPYGMWVPVAVWPTVWQCYIANCSTCVLYFYFTLQRGMLCRHLLNCLTCGVLNWKLNLTPKRLCDDAAIRHNSVSTCWCVGGARRRSGVDGMARTQGSGPVSGRRVPHSATKGRL